MKDKKVEKIERMISCVGIGVKGVLFFDNERFMHDATFSDLHNDSDLPFLMEKMNNILNHINENPELVDKDIEKDLWNL